MGAFDGLASLSLQSIPSEKEKKRPEKDEKRLERVHLLQEWLQLVLTPSPGV